MTANSWRVLGSSVRGSSHVKRQVECQDAHVVQMIDDARFVIAVADGAGSAKRAAEGASAASAAAAEHIQYHQANAKTQAECEDLLRSSIVAARTKLETLAAETGSPLADFGTTLLVCCADTQSNWLGVASIGDGAIVLRQHDGTLDLIQPTRQSEYLNETDFVTSLRGLEHILLDVRPLEQVNAIAVFTDGVEWAAIKFKERTPHAAFFQPLFSHVANQAVTAADLDEFLGSERFCQQTDDDKTLVIAVRGDAVKHDAMSI